MVLLCVVWCGVVCGGVGWCGVVVWCCVGGGVLCCVVLWCVVWCGVCRCVVVVLWCCERVVYRHGGNIPHFAGAHWV